MLLSEISFPANAAGYQYIVMSVSYVPILCALMLLGGNGVAIAESPKSWASLSEDTRVRMEQMDEYIRGADKERAYKDYLAIFHEDVVAHGMLESGPANKDELRSHYHPVFFELKDGVLLSDNVIVAGNMAAQRYHSLLYLRGRFDGVDADNAPVFLRGQTFFRFDAQQKIVERWSNHDHAFRLQQLLGADGAAEGRRISAVLNGPGLSEKSVRARLVEMNVAFNNVTAPAERRQQYAMFFRDDVIVHGLAADVVGLGELNRYYDRLWRAFPDLERQYDAVISAWSYGAVRWRALGSHRDSFGGETATLRPTKLTGEMIAKFDPDGRITEIWINDATAEQQ